MEEETVEYNEELAELNLQENTFPEPNEAEGKGEVKETDEFYTSKKDGEE